MSGPSGVAGFATLAPDVVMDRVEQVSGRRASGICRPLASYINRVFEIGLADGGYLVAKFYRPGRWTRAALQDEHDFLRELAADEISVVAPLADAAGRTLHEQDGIHFAVFPRRGGRPCDEPSRAEWQQIGRLIGRIHQVGARKAAAGRITIDPRHSARIHLEFLRAAGAIPREVEARYLAVAQELLDRIAPRFDGVARQRLHGDLHRMNLLWRPGEGFHAIDFDDMANGPAIQDLWMLLPDRLPAARSEFDLLLAGYETFAEYDDAQTRLIEPLRALRYLHYAAWCARQKADEGRTLLHPEWGTADFWRRELADLQRQAQDIMDLA
ncbi:MAG: serine/threonine protein kinase [Kiritimatiellae bacterium]|jgi:Ser/Thr protein kinase RdoA (MazF antagonist)|nr:serine/threonine protein kinase [Kiritimatiellia bacterium]NLD90362.1 serine/threonine protein kinase [Lentisphaerota bacterium]HOU22395.1 serine/threonine protein kinase [Kiritimatiellia bacterium]HPC19482.1 serine/threonine protein kinase [Kiritimatiellia bacterium]